ncbi:FixH family protein [Robertmurraya sp. FSL W8-0741]|uniref:FixH family protein n=1 Tax=Robertmurraya TaxID=2837507 RepID=UPI001F3293BA|nr:FixH family protein [Robertmurraya siralis]
MKKFLFALASLLFLLTACNKDSVAVEVEKDLYYEKDADSELVIKITDDNEPVSGLKVNAVLAMSDMDHGQIEADFKEIGEGIYSSEVKLPMAGKWEIVFTFDHNGKSVEKVITYDVKEPSGIAKINGEWITNEDLEFYQFINELHIAINREQDKAKYEGDELEEALAYWDGQEKLNQDRNQLLTQIIRLRSMALLALEKGHEATQKEVTEQVKQVRTQYEAVPVAKKMIQEFGEEKFWNKEQQQYELIVLSQKVQNDLIAQVRKENPDVNEQEILYLAQKQYEELLVSQVNSLTIELL